MVLKYCISITVFEVSIKTNLFTKIEILSRLIILSHVEFIGDTVVYQKSNFQCRPSKKEEADRSSFLLSTKECDSGLKNRPLQETWLLPMR